PSLYLGSSRPTASNTRLGVGGAGKSNQVASLDAKRTANPGPASASSKMEATQILKRPTKMSST
ncbi:unnamed protein product, partial [Amoebophrya sp. A25]